MVKKEVCGGYVRMGLHNMARNSARHPFHCSNHHVPNSVKITTKRISESTPCENFLRLSGLLQEFSDGLQDPDVQEGEEDMALK
jgi:hypothetical protein